MKTHTVSLINALTLIVLSLWGYLGSETPSITALIPAFVGVVLLALNGGIKKQNKVIAHIAVLLTFIILIGLIKPLTGALERADYGALARVVLMLLTTLWALGAFIKSFIEARKKTTP